MHPVRDPFSDHDTPLAFAIRDFRAFKENGYRHHNGTPTNADADEICRRLAGFMFVFIEAVRFNVTRQPAPVIDDCRACLMDAIKDMRWYAHAHSNPEVPHNELQRIFHMALEPGNPPHSGPRRALIDDVRQLVEKEVAKKTLSGDRLLFDLSMTGWKQASTAWLQGLVMKHTLSMDPPLHFRFCFELARCAENGGNPVMRDFALERLKDHFFYLENYEPEKAGRMLRNYLGYYDNGARPNPERSWGDAVRIGFRYAADVLRPYSPPREACRDGVVLDTLRTLRREMRDKKAQRRINARASRDPS